MAADPAYATEEAIIAAAERFPDSWAACVCSMEAQLSLHVRPTPIQGETKAQLKYRMRQHMLEDTQPALRALEQTSWADCHKNRLQWGLYDTL